MIGFICPVCGEGLTLHESVYRCGRGHCYDLARSGYVNLLINSRQGNHGDDKIMVRARSAFLNKGYYRPLYEIICGMAADNVGHSGCILDAGCGECYYTAGVAAAAPDAEILGVDVSKNALAAGASRNRRIRLAVGSVYHLPVGDASADLLLNVFSPYCGEEYGRVLKKEGLMLRVVPLENHLLGLKKVLYERIILNERKDPALKGFTLLEEREYKSEITIENNEDLMNLFAMTPYYYTTGAEGKSRMTGVHTLTTEIECSVLLYRKGEDA